MKKCLFKGERMLLLLLLLCVVGTTNVTQAQSAWEQEQNYLFYLVYADYQVGEHIMPQRENYQYDAIRRNLLPTREYQGTQVDLWYDQSDPNTWTNGLIGLAKNETEGFQVFFREQEKERSLRIEVSPFVYENDTLKHAVYYEEFFFLTPQPELNPPDSLAEALVPYHPNQIKQTSIGHNKVFYVELKATKNQTPGEYTSTITAYDGDDLIDTRTAIAKVWNFALPENHYSEVVMGLHNRNSGYPSTSSLFTLNGIPVDNNGNVAEEYLDDAKRILQGYHNCLLEHGVSTYEIPRWLMEDDPKAAELAMADPRRKVFEVPVHWSDLSGLSFNASAQSVLNQYKDIVYDNEFLKDKAFFYPMDEPNWNNQEIVNRFNNVCVALSDSWSDYHAVIPFNSEYDSTVQRFEGKIDILCPNQDMFDPWVWYDPYNSNIPVCEDRLQDFKTRDHTWRYHGGKQNGGLQCFIDAIAPVGTMRRILFWQQYAFDSDGLLYWNCSYLPNNWVKKTLPASGGIQTGNGDGILLYPSTMFGQEDAAKPVVSLRLKQLAEGIDDYDYLRLAQEFLGEDYARNKLQHVYWDIANNPDNYLCFFLNRQYGVYYPNNCKWMNQARHLIGEALSAANTEHNWGEWLTAVQPDATHNGLEIRTCSNCGAQESRETPLITITQEIPLGADWNWFSTYIEADDLLSQLETSLGANGVSINTQGAVMVYRNGRWIGSMNGIENDKGYKVKASAPVEVTIEGQMVDPANYPITITEGSNWIGYPLSESKTVEVALAGFTPSNGDVIMTQGGTTVYRNGSWVPSTFTFDPGKSYIYKSTSTTAKTLIFSNGK